MLHNKSIDVYVNKQYRLYSLSTFQFGKYYSFLWELINHREKETPINLINKLNIFFVCSNLLDDIMDKDNEDIENIENLNKEFPVYLKRLLSSIDSNLSKEEFSVFIDYVSKSLHYQHIESNSLLTIDTTEDDYFSLYVKRSVCLLQAAVPFNRHNSLNSLYVATKYLAFFGQIKNDIEDLRGQKSSDLLNSRPTLPLIKAIEFAVTEKNDEMVKQILFINEKNYCQSSYDSIIKFIYEKDILEGCAEIALYFFDKARKELIIHFPLKEEFINSFFANLIVKDE